MGGIFINYRGEDSETAAALIDRELTARFGSDQVFLDCRSIPAGADYVEELLRRARVCSVLLVVIGPRWLTLTDNAGNRRIDDSGDWVRREIAEALSHGLRLIPVLIDDTRLPAATDLPDDIAGLSRRQYVPLRRRYTYVDLAYLVERIAEADTALTRCAVHGRADSGGAVVISVISGTAGKWKNALAAHWAHQVADRFTGGQPRAIPQGLGLSKHLSPDIGAQAAADLTGIPQGCRTGRPRRRWPPRRRPQPR